MPARIVATLSLCLLLLAPARSFAQCEDWYQGPLDDGTLPNGANGPVFSSITWDPDGAGPLLERLVVGGDFTMIGGVAAQNIAQYDPAQNAWFPFGPGIATNVSALAIYNGELVAGCSGDNNVGTFDSTVRRWNGTSWVSLSATNTGHVKELLVHNGELYIAGSFMTHFTTDTDPAHYIARYSPSQDKWIAMPEAGFGTETNAQVDALVVHNGEIYAGGNKRSDFTVTNNAIHVTRGLGTSPWTAITDLGDAGSIQDMAVFAGEVIIVGGFNEVNGAVCHNMAGWNGSSWHGFNNGVSSPSPNSALIWSITIHQGIVVGGDFMTASGQTVNHVAFWPPGGFQFQPLSSGTDGRIYTLASYRGQLIVGGDFDNTSVPASNIARWNGTQWSALSGGTASTVRAFVNYRGRMVAGGSFAQPTGSFGTAFNIGGWSGGPIQEYGSGMNSTVYALESFKYSGVFGDYEMIAGGSFTTAGGVAASRIARWREDPVAAFPPPAWEAMGSGFNGTVNAIERWGSTTYAGGSFSHSGGTLVSSIARWNETTDVWENIGGTNGIVYALREYNGYLYVGGSFSAAGGVGTNGLARWNGSSWSAFGVAGTVYSLEVHDGKLIIGGQFTAFGGTNLVAYDGVSAFPLVSGTNGIGVFALRSSGDRLYAGGSFTTCGGVSAQNVAWYDGSWHALEGGTASTVYALGRLNSETHVGGAFKTVDAPTLTSPHWARYSESGLPFITLHPFNKTVSLGSNVNFSCSVGGGFQGVVHQWFQNDQMLFDGPQPDGSVIVGANSEVLTINNVVWTSQGQYRMEASNGCGSVSSFAATLSLDATPAPESFSNVFYALGPNPSGGQTMLDYALARPARVDFAVHDLRGRLVRRVQLGTVEAGRHRAHWDARDGSGSSVAAGVYFVTLELDGRKLDSKRLTVVR